MSLRFGRSRKVSGKAAIAAIESLESRAYFSAGVPVLTVTVPGPIAPTAISGQKFNDRIAVNVANGGTGKTTGRYTFTLLASADMTLDSGDSQIYQVTRGLNVAAQRNKNTVLRVPSLPVNLDGSYFILAQVTGTQASAIGSSTSQIAITPAHVDLSDAITKVPTTARLGKKIPVTLVLTNNGNAPAKNVLDVAFADSPLPTGASPAALGTVSTHINLKANSSKTLHLKVTVPLGTLSGNQYIVATVDPSDVFNDTNLANNVTVSAAPVSLH
ncbi:MAG TPA: CARDB domain-containing protein [Tepidisphaeraceae bacterium]|nr:CARDB domain-containing protein [Tepidisphaeraceae bacterium]